MRYKVNGSAEMTDPSLVRASWWLAAAVVRARLQSMVRESSATVVSGSDAASRLRDRVEFDASHGAAVHQRWWSRPWQMRKREDEVFPNAAGIDVGRRATGWRCRGTCQMSRCASSAR
jgi:hypothetical protein